MGDLIRAARRNAAQLLFERRYGVQTSGHRYLEEFDQAGDERVYYVAANWLTLRRSLHQRDIRADDVFIDLGSGMGRMVLEAARYPFKRVIGVELAEPLHDLARANVAQTRQHLRCRDIGLVCSDVLEYEIPDDVTVVFLNNPFRGEIFARVVAKLITSADSNPRDIKLIYYNPAEEEMLLDTGRFVRQRTISHIPLRKTKSAFGCTSIYALTRPAAFPTGHDDRAHLPLSNQQDGFVARRR